MARVLGLVDPTRNGTTDHFGVIFLKVMCAGTELYEAARAQIRDERFRESGGDERTRLADEEHFRVAR